MALKRRLLIVGGGCVGSSLALSLENEFLVTLIDNKSYLEFIPSRLRMLVEPQSKQFLRIPHSSYLSKSTIVIQGTVASISNNFVCLSSGERFFFDFLVICTGLRYSNSFSTRKINSSDALPDETLLSNFSKNNFKSELKTNGFHNNHMNENHQNIPNHVGNNYNSNCLVVSARAENLEQYSSKIEMSSKILIIGGGLVGLELAAEICSSFNCVFPKTGEFSTTNPTPNSKHLYLVHSHERLFSHGPLAVSQSAQSFLERNGVKIILGERVIQQKGNQFITNVGTIIEAEIAFQCIGNLPNTEIFKDSTLFQDYLNNQGFVNVTPHLNLSKHPHIFVAGDIAFIEGQREKLCQAATAQVSILSFNIRSFDHYLSHFSISEANFLTMEKLEATGFCRMKHYVSKEYPLVITLGKLNAIFTFHGFSLCGFFPSLMKEVIELKELSPFWSFSYIFSKQYFFGMPKQRNEFLSSSKRNGEQQSNVVPFDWHTLNV